MKTFRPVKIAASREDIFCAYRHGQPLIVEVKTGVLKDGTLEAQQFQRNQQLRCISRFRSGGCLSFVGICHVAVSCAESPI